MTQDPGTGLPDASMLTPEQQHHYQQAYQQAMHAQQLYAQAQQAYAQAQGQGDEALAHEAYYQAQHAQQMYTQAHQSYQAILQQVESAQQSGSQAAQAERQAQLAAQAEAERQAQLAAQAAQAEAERQAQLAAQAEAERQARLAAQAEAERQAQLAAQAEAERQAQLAAQAAQAEAERQAQLAAQAEAERQAQLAAQIEAARQAQQAEADRQAQWAAEQQAQYSQQQIQAANQMAAQHGYAVPSQPQQFVTNHYGQQVAAAPHGAPQHPQQGGYPSHQNLHPTHGYASQSPEMQGHPYPYSQQAMAAGQMHPHPQASYSQQQMMAAQQAGWSQGMMPNGGQQVVTGAAPRQQQVVVANQQPHYASHDANGAYSQQQLSHFLDDAEPTMAAHSYSELPSYSHEYLSASAHSLDAGESLSDVWGVQAAEFSPKKRGGSWFFWTMLLFVMCGGVFLYKELSKSKPRKDPFAAEKPKKRLMSDKERAAWKELRESEKNTRYLRPMKFSKPKQELSGLAVTGAGECRSLFLFGKNKQSWVSEGGVSKKAPDYVQKPYTDRPIPLSRLGVPGRVSFSKVVRGMSREYLFVRTTLSGKKWLAVYPLVGDPVRRSRKAGNRSSEIVCGDSKVKSHLRKDKMLLFGEGACELGQRAFGVKPWGCFNMDPSRTKTVGVFLRDRTLRSRRPRGALLLGRQLIQFRGRRVSRTDNELLALRLKYATPLTVQAKKRRWVGLDKRTGKLFALDRRLKIKDLAIKVPIKPRRILGVLLKKGSVRVVLRDRLADYDVDRKSGKLTLSAKYRFGENISVKRIAWGHKDQVLLLYTRRHSVYQFSDNP